MNHLALRRRNISNPALPASSPIEAGSGTVLSVAVKSASPE